MRDRAARISGFFELTRQEAARRSVRRRWESHVMQPGLGSRCFQLRGIVVRHGGYARGGDTTLGLYKLQVVAFDECLFALELRLAAVIKKLTIEHLQSGTNSLLPISSHKSALVSSKYAAFRPPYAFRPRWSGQRRRRSPDCDDRHPVLHGVHIRHRSMPLCPAHGRRRDMRNVESRGERLL